MYLLALLMLLSVPCSHSYTSKYADSGAITENFSIPSGLEPAVDFWIEVYSKYDVNNVIVHDSDYHIVYEVIDTSDIDSMNYFSDAIKQEIVDSRIISVQKKYKDALKKLGVSHDKAEDLDPFLYSVYMKFKDVTTGDKFIEACRPGRMRVQKGQASNFKKGIEYSSKYLPEMERAFKQENLPVELTRIPFVESYFDTGAVSKAEASGIWQFMKGTGKEYLKVKKEYDERRDPLLSTQAAVRLLKQSYKYLGKSWPLAVTAYNHGMYGMKKASSSVGSRDLVKIIKEYRGDRFGFASKNFYAEFLAALYVEKHHQNIFEDVNHGHPSNYGVVVTMKPMNISQLELLLDVGKIELKQYNPALSKKVFSGEAVVPEGAKLRVPISRFKRLLSRTEVVKGITNYVKII
jgi:membrane-bound lytic murein transglycosylase D